MGPALTGQKQGSCGHERHAGQRPPPRAQGHLESRGWGGPWSNEMPAEWCLTQLKGTFWHICPWSQDWRFSNSNTSKFQVDH